MSFDFMSIFAYLAGLAIIYIFFRIIFGKVKWFFKAIVNGLIGGVSLLLVKFLGGFVGLSVTVNPLSALLAGFLGLPGVILVIVLQNFF